MPTNNRKLSSGLGSVFGQDIDDILKDIEQGRNETYSGNREELPIEDIRSNPYQPRVVFNQEALEELAKSIEIHGVFQPIIVRKALQGYELVSGERRLKASKIAGKKTIPAIVVDFNETEMMEISLLENIQRENLTPIEEAKGYQALITHLGYTQEQLAERVGKSRVHVTNTLRLLRLPEVIQNLVVDEKLSAGHARCLINLEDEDTAIRLANKTISEGLSVRELEKLVSELKNPVRKPEPAKKETDPNLVNVENIIRSKLQTRVDVTANKVIIHYKDTDNLNRILEIIGCLDGE